MNSEPPKLLQSIVRYLLPQGAREHVLGDLQERFADTRSAALYLFDALRILPYVIRGQAARHIDRRLVAVEAAAVATSLVVGSLRMSADARAAMLPVMIVALLAALAALVLGDIYVEPRNRARFHTLRQVLLAYGSAWLAASLAGRLVPMLAPARTIITNSASTGTVLLLIARITFNALSGDNGLQSPPGSIAEVRRHAELFRRRIRQRNLTEYGAVLAGMLLAPWILGRALTPLSRAGLVLAIVGQLYIAYELYRRGSSRTSPAGLSDVDALRFYRAELVRQRDALAQVHRWYIAPLLPAIALMIAGQMTHTLGSLAFPALLWAALLFLIIWLNRRAAGQMQRRIDALDVLEKP